MIIQHNHNTLSLTPNTSATNNMVYNNNSTNNYVYTCTVDPSLLICSLCVNRGAWVPTPKVFE